MTEPIEDIDEEIRRIAAPLRRLYDRELEVKEELLVRRAANQARLTQLAKTLRAVDPTFELEVGPTKKKKGSTPFYAPKPESLAKVYEAIRDGAETTKLIMEATGLSDGTCSRAVIELRQRELIRKAGETDTRATIFKVLALNEQARDLPIQEEAI